MKVPGDRPHAGRGVLLEAGIVGALWAAGLLGLSRFEATIYNNYVLLAQALLHGHVWIDWPGGYIDALLWRGAYYVIEGPLPALLMLPLVAIFGRATNQTAFACAVGGAALGVAWFIARKLRATRGAAALLTAFFGFGTSFAWCAVYGGVWFTAHIVAVLFALLALAEIVGRRRAWLVTTFLLLAAGARFTFVLAVPPLVAYALWTTEPSRRLRALVPCGLVVMAALGLYLAYNFTRWGVLYDLSYTTWYHRDPIGEPTGSPFRFTYVPYELRAFFFSPFPTLIGRYPWVVPGYSSVPLTLTSPALVLAFFARGQRWLIASMWIATMALAIPSLMYYADGGTQFGMRHALDFEPFLFVLMTLAIAERRVPWVFINLICGFSVLVGIWGLWFWRAFYDASLMPHFPPEYFR